MIVVSWQDGAEAKPNQPAGASAKNRIMFSLQPSSATDQEVGRFANATKICRKMFEA